MVLQPVLLLTVLVPVTVVTALRQRRTAPHCTSPTQAGSANRRESAESQPDRHGAPRHQLAALPAMALALCAVLAALALALVLFPAAHVQRAMPRALQDGFATRMFRRRALGLREARHRLSRGQAPAHIAASEWPAAQQLFEAALSVAYSFNHQQARRLFAQALAEDEACTWCAWGRAYSSGPFLNMVRPPPRGNWSGHLDAVCADAFSEQIYLPG